MKVLFFSNLYPDANEPNRGIYNARLIRQLATLCEVRVVSPRASLPFLSAGDRFACTEDSELSPVFPTAHYIPKIGSRWNHKLMTNSVRATLETVREAFEFDVILGSWIYPDCCAISLIANELGAPFIATAQGSDVHQYLEIPARREIILDALTPASKVITRSNELGRLLAEAGVNSGKIETIYNGVDHETFNTADKEEARRELGLPLAVATLLYVGNFYAIKNPLLLIRAHAELCNEHPDRVVRLVMIGDGPLRKAAEGLAQELGFAQWIAFLGKQPPSKVARHMQAADLLCVPSDNEGVPNVILEAFASGLRVAASNVGGIPEIMTEDFLGELIDAGNEHAWTEALARLINAQSDCSAIREHAARFSWNETASRYMEALQGAVEG